MATAAAVAVAVGGDTAAQIRTVPRRCLWTRARGRPTCTYAIAFCFADSISRSLAASAASRSAIRAFSLLVGGVLALDGVATACGVGGGAAGTPGDGGSSAGPGESLPPLLVLAEAAARAAAARAAGGADPALALALAWAAICAYISTRVSGFFGVSVSAGLPASGSIAAALLSLGKVF